MERARDALQREYDRVLEELAGREEGEGERERELARCSEVIAQLKLQLSSAEHRHRTGLEKVYRPSGRGV